jgi:hypothetical protein
MSQPSHEANDSCVPPMAAMADPQLIVLEALKIAHAFTGAARYSGVYEQLRQRMGRQPGNGTGGGIGTGGPARMRLVCATRKDRDGFFSDTPLGRSLSLHRPAGVELRLFPRNTQGLPAVYNTAISESIADDAILVFLHDDVHLCDFHWAQRLASGLSVFELVGLVGNRRRVASQPGWLFIDEALTRDSREHLSGAVAHGRGLIPDSIDVFGPAGQPVKLLDGLLLAVSTATLRSRPLRFDERFDFHFYDLDFCRQAERAGVTMGTWPVSVIHESKGSFASDGWRRSYETYLDKWGE